MRFEVGDVVTWVDNAKGENYDPGPYVVEHLHPADYRGISMPCVRCTRLDGSPLYYRRSDGVPVEHEWIQEQRLRLEPFLTAARKAVADARTA